MLPPVTFPESEELSRRNAIRKKSIIGAQLSRLRRLSFQRSLSTPVNNVSFHEFSEKCYTVITIYSGTVDRTIIKIVNS